MNLRQEEQMNKEPNFLFAKNRDNLINIKYIILGDRLELEELNGNSFELYINLHSINADEFNIYLRSSDDYSEYILLSYQKKHNHIFLDYSQSITGDGNQNEVNLVDEDLKELNIFCNNHSIEIYINEGKENIKTLINPKSKNIYTRLEAVGGMVKINKITKWELNI